MQERRGWGLRVRLGLLTKASYDRITWDMAHSCTAVVML